VHLAEPIRSVGTHEVTIRLHPEVEASVTVEVAAQ
jgi:ribosomal protein L9